MAARHIFPYAPIPLALDPVICPLVSAPREQCHCSKLTSQRIPLIVLYCAGNYAECDLYQEYRRSVDSHHHPPKEELRECGKHQ
ncbi:hypothetical protein [Geoalkalibacter sp.]|uniref:hypothetical protein n=1 Tax=Geoalkalibacter sp. TaxID=3041440 RepID=UPI00272EB554|nr:hypothetical protein [Geoalkalibacter sp.]